MRYAIVAAVLALAACGGNTDGRDSGPAPVESMFSVTPDAVSCDGTAYQTWAPSGGPYTSATCVWYGVTLGGEPVREAVAAFARDDDASPWVLVSLSKPFVR